MVKAKKDLTGKRFGILTVIKRDEEHANPKNPNWKLTKWICKCDCGNYKSVFQNSLEAGGTKSCGCMHYKWTKKYNEYENVDSNTVRVFLTNCNESFICDADDWERLKKYCWSKGIAGYPEARVDGKNRLLHHIILPDCPDGMVRDHINTNKMDNRKENLRIVTRSINNSNKRVRNRHGYKGIVWSRAKVKPYYVCEHINGKRIYHGRYTLEEAIAKSKEIYGFLSEAYKD